MLTQFGTKLFRAMPPETAHLNTISALKMGIGVPKKPPEDDSRLATTLAKSGLKLSNPIGLAAGFDKNCDVPSAMSRFGFGFVECGTVTPLPQGGNPRPRLFRLTADNAVINRMGFNNQGLETFIKNLQSYDGAAILGTNVGANKTSDDRPGDYETGMKSVWAHSDYITINISSPNTPGLRGLQDKAALTELLSRCQSAADNCAAEHNVARSTFLKVAPDLDDDAIVDICAVMNAEGAWLSGLIVSNTTIARPEALTSKHKAEMGGLSGAPLFKPSTEVLRKFAKKIFGKFDLIGAGGISSGAQAYEKIKAGAGAVQLYSALVYNGPQLVSEIKRDLLPLLERDGHGSLSSVCGAGL